MNYQEMMEKTLAALGERRPRLLLHACCAPCASYPLELLSSRFEITVFYCNPNIMPLEEYEKRLGEFDKLRRYPFRLVSEPWDNGAFLSAVRGREGDREGGERCSLCFRLRLGCTAEKAAAEGFDFFATTLTVSPHKNAQLINAIGAELAAQTGAAWLYSDFKKREGYKRSLELCRELEIYRQNYCGCRLTGPASV
ncbi:MAG: epoxyqueuosine reductase QueH [Oscillospiraceae bacterium]|nr:epoxyqueuosine reductase QueH [Oscillospiraceae bacterium]MBR4691376.1 epoxyqueuosine reductase QueH [Oscillospiraceae bacterium]